LWCLLVLAPARSEAALSLFDTTGPSPRSDHRLGLIIGLNDPVPAVAALSLAYNLFDFVRLQAGVGRFNSDYHYGGFTIETRSLTYAFGSRFLVPGWRISPLLGVSWATILTDGFPNADHHFSISAGVDWQAPFGLDVAAGYNQSFEAAIGGLPFLNVGWFFPL
jgi:hypothetical protein